MNQVEVYTDGSCFGNPGTGGWAYVIVLKNRDTIQRNGSSPHTTNNRMELRAIIQSLDYICKSNLQFDTIVIYTDSKYIADTFNCKWINNWYKNNWITSTKTPVKNKDLFVILYNYYIKYDLHFRWVKGHSTNTYNNIVDQLAVDANRNQLNSEEDVGYIHGY